MTLEARLKSFLTPDQIEKLSVALENIEMRERAKSAPAPSPAPEKVINWREGDRWAEANASKWLFVLRGTKATSVEFVQENMGWIEAQPKLYTKLTDSEGDTRAAELGYTVKRTAKVEPTRAVEVDKFGREIVERLGGAFIVKCLDGWYTVSREDGRWYAGNSWDVELRPTSGAHKIIENAKANLSAAAASLELPTANPAASAKPYAFNGPIPSGPSAAEFSDLRLRVGDLEREVAALKAVK